ncbi:MAG: hypothetical protein QOE25_1112, partial [Actinomycetota bacterium]|nr:hypothetical protein [Actinomycetota bacterium]
MRWPRSDALIAQQRAEMSRLAAASPSR